MFEQLSTATNMGIEAVQKRMRPSSSTPSKRDSAGTSILRSRGLLSSFPRILGIRTSLSWWSIRVREEKRRVRRDEEGTKTIFISG
jgi:hypothetical protein